MSLTLWSSPLNANGFKSLITAKYAGVEVKRVEEFQMGVTNKTPEYLAKQPFGQIPLLDTPHGPLFESNTLTRYIAREGSNKTLYGSNNYEASVVDQWMDEARSVEPHIAGWVYPLLGYMDYNKEAVEKCKAKALSMLAIVNKQFAAKGTKFLTGDNITIADICVFCSLIFPMKNVFSAEIRATIPAICEWFERCSGEENFKTVTGEITLCVSELVEPPKKA